MVFINEIDYQGSTNEYLEIGGIAGTDLSGYTVESYSQNGVLLQTKDVNGIIADQGHGGGVVPVYFQSRTFNDNKGAFALVDPSGNVVQFIGFGGTVTAKAGGAASGMTSIDTGVTDAGGSNDSIQLTGTGFEADDFNWTTGNIRRSKPNTDQKIECFVTGTRILTEDGYKLVENLQIGDLVEIANGKVEPIKWIGYQKIAPQEVPNPLRGYPILIKAGALGNHAPCRDLYVSPDHAFLVDGLLINAGALVNDLSIIKTEPTETFTYYQIELKNHSLIIAEGASAESYLARKNDRQNYDNSAEYEELYPEGSNLMLWPMDYPRISSKNKVPSFVNNKLMNLAYELTGQFPAVCV